MVRIWGVSGRELALIPAEVLDDAKSRGVEAIHDRMDLQLILMPISSSQHQREAENELAFAALHGHEEGHAEIAELLLQAVTVKKEKGSFCNGALLAASDRGHAEIVRLLLQFRADSSVTDHFRRTPLFRAAEKGHADVVRLLLEAGVKADADDICSRTALVQASAQGQVDVVQLLLEVGAHKARELSLLCASENGHVDIVRLLLQAGVDYDQKDKYSKTAILRAAENGHKQTVALLLEAGANSSGSIDCAARHGHFDIVLLLLEAGAVADREDTFLRAAESGHVETVRWLLEAGVDKFEGFILDETFEQFLQQRAVSGAWGDMCTLLALADALGIEIVVIQEEATIDVAPLRGPPQGKLYLVHFQERHFDATGRLDVYQISGTVHAGFQISSVATKLCIKLGPQASKISAAQFLQPSALTITRYLTILLEAAVDKDLSDHYARTPLLCATAKGYEEIACLLQADLLEIRM
ncbi:Ankyrin repeat domain-containing protein 17 [Symbiodinium microadriaticum]|uniref:Ankyrin repeat domain-containing protein 17 n=1 Tax=Symbiodinium microadriaticum TaxID=2951 RepID=A0A1Q9DDV7_SYMMI|nr:Ankyrin repeat domain-containing protein 17 [Symbiodinium microadriaticum]